MSPVAPKLSAIFRKGFKYLTNQMVRLYVSVLSRRKPRAFPEFINRSKEYVRQYFTSSYIIQPVSASSRKGQFSGCPLVARNEIRKEKSTRKSWAFFCGGCSWSGDSEEICRG